MSKLIAALCRSTRLNRRSDDAGSSPAPSRSSSRMDEDDAGAAGLGRGSAVPQARQLLSENDIVLRTDRERSTFNELRLKEFEHTRVFDQDLLRRTGMDEEFPEIFHAVGWENFWEINEPDSIVGSPPSAASRDERTGNVDATKDVATPIVGSKLTCNFSNRQSNTCTMEGDLRVHGKSATVYVVSASTYRPENSTIKLRPYARKWEDQVMLLVREVTVRSTPPLSGAEDDITPPECSVLNDVPAVVFSTGGYNRNFFHVMTDVIIPLYLTAREYNGRVQLLATDYEPQWIAKYKAILAALSTYPVIDIDSEDSVRCFPSVRVGLESHKELGIVPGLSPNGYTMVSFRDFIRSAYSLQRPRAAPVSKSSGRKPRLVLILRRNSRQLMNEADAIATAADAGFEVVAAGPDDVSDLERFSGVVNSCDVLMGVHGAGLANMLFLPHNATVVQIIPWGELKWPCRHSFGDPVAPMGLRYLEYEATAMETTLNETYPRDHAVFTDPLSIHRQGFDKVWNIFINGQHVILDIKRFRGFMEQLYQAITTGVE